jgi:ATP-dependent helicase/nuclease subunit B
MKTMSCRIFLNRRAPLLPQALAWLASGWESSDLDLSGTLVVVPTRTALRRLHEGLVSAAASGGGALMPPAWALPMQLLEAGHGCPAPSSVEQMCWITVLRSASPRELRALFPGSRVPVMDTAHAAELGVSINSLRADLAAAGLSFARLAEGEEREDPRWAALGVLEGKYLETLRQREFGDRIFMQLVGMTGPKLPGGTNRVVIAGVPDLPAAYDTAVPALLREGTGVSVLVHDPEDRGGDWFDGLGRPSGRWSEGNIDIPDETIHVCAGKEEMAQTAGRLSLLSGGSHETTTIGVSSPELARFLHDTLEGMGLPIYDPAGQPLSSSAVGRLLRLTRLHLLEEDFRSAMRLLRHADILRWLSRDGDCFGATELERLDDLQRECLPVSLGDLLSRWPADAGRASSDAILKQALVRFADLTRSLRDARGSLPVLRYLRVVYGHRMLDALPGSAEAAVRIRDWILPIADLSGDMPPVEVITLLLDVLAAPSSGGEKIPGALELQGWLELLWEDAPHLVIAGMSDGLVPEVRPADSFLSEKLRTRLGMPSNATRFSRDCYLIRSLRAARPEKEGRVDLLFSRHDAEGSLGKPSRLLLKCADRELPARVKKLFAESPLRPGSPWRSSWRLVPPPAGVPDQLSATSVRDYLSCPARYFFKHRARLVKKEFGLEELDAATFGVLLHEALQEFGSRPDLNNLGDEQRIGAALETIWRDRFRGRFGEDLTLPLLYQLGIGIRRLRKAAEVQARHYAAGWRIVACELKFTGFRPAGLDGLTMPLPLGGRIDRVDRRETEEGVEWLILDYKSGEKADDPDKTHYRKLGALESPALYPDHEVMSLVKTSKARGKAPPATRHFHARWTDLQLPIYILLGEAVRDRIHVLDNLIIDGGTVSGGYFLLPADLSKTEIRVFRGFDGWQIKAGNCLAGVSSAISRGCFWPPRRPKHDEFEGLFFNRLEALQTELMTVDTTLLKGEGAANRESDP